MFDRRILRVGRVCLRGKPRSGLKSRKLLMIGKAVPSLERGNEESRLLFSTIQYWPVARAAVVRMSLSEPPEELSEQRATETRVEALFGKG
jgi:hypothetical protein